MHSLRYQFILWYFVPDLVSLPVDLTTHCNRTLLLIRLRYSRSLFCLEQGRYGFQQSNHQSFGIYVLFLRPVITRGFVGPVLNIHVIIRTKNKVKKHVFPKCIYASSGVESDKYTRTPNRLAK